MEGGLEYFDYSAYQGPAEDSGETMVAQPQHFSHPMNAHLPDQSRAPLFHPPVPQQLSHDAKPRLTKEQTDVLEAHFRASNKPNTTTKKAFAETLNVTLDKVNNWFQNRRAKSKQEAKKAAGQVAIHRTYSGSFISDSEPSPYQPPPSYLAMMPSEEEDRASNALGISHMPHPQPQAHGLSFNNDPTSHAQLQNFNFAHGQPMDPFDGSQDLNRLTMTQEQFDMMSRSCGIPNTDGQFENFDMGYAGDHDALNHVFPEMELKPHGVPFGYPVVAQPLSSNDSTAPSVISEQAFPNSNAMQQHHANMSAPGSDWTDSRSSSLASSYRGTMGAPVPPVQAQSQLSTSQWEPGQSVPVNVDAMKDEFQQVAAQANQARASIDQSQTQDYPLAYPEDDAYARRGSTASIVQSMGGIGLQTPQPNQSNGVFRPPMPPANIAARRQRPRPANLSLRSQSFGGPGQPASPGHQHTAPPNQVRRVISNNVMNGGVVQGRVQKSMPGSAQRSPLNWNFNDALNSPHLVRTVSHGNLAPPTPMSPSHPNHAQQVPGWPAVSNQGARHPSINENEDQTGAGISYQSSMGVPPHVSPPHTPHWSQQPFAPYRVGSNVIMENTPPQSAPASQQCFPSNVFAPPPPPPNPHAAAIANSQHQQYLNLAVPDQQFQMSNVTFAPSQHASVVSSGPAPGVPLTFAEGVPSFNAAGNMHMKFSPPMPLMQPEPPQMPYAFVNSNDGSPNIPSGPFLPKLPTQPANDFVVHEYSPPDSIKRSATPRKPVDSGPKSYTFAHSHPTDFQEKKAKQETSSSPASSHGTVSTS